MTLHDYQQAAVDDGLAWLTTAGPGDCRLYASPTGTGKSYMELGLQSAVPGSWIITPRLEIIAGLLEKRGAISPDSKSGEMALLTAAREQRIITPIRLRSALLNGEIPAPRLLIFDEAHHDLAASYQDIHLLCGYAPAVGYTATPFRGTPRASAAFREQWGEPVWVITFAEAVERGVLSMPECETVPLLDDDEIEVSNGELVAKQVSNAVGSRVDAAVGLAGAFVSGYPIYGWDKPTMFSLPSRETAYMLHSALRENAVPSAVVTGETPYSDRQTAFRACCDRELAIIQIGVVSEGVDLPIRRLIDLAPTLSPVKWLQQFGRITRPTKDEAPHYVCTNRNLLRHGYLLDGCLPVASMAQAQAAFPTPSQRSGLRAVGLEALGRLKPTDIPLKSGLQAIMYALCDLKGHVRRDYTVFVSPLSEDVVWATRERVMGQGVTVSYGNWHRCDPPADLSGFASLPPSPVSEKQLAWWKRSAASAGLDPDITPNRKQFQALPVLCGLRARLT